MQIKATLLAALTAGTAFGRLHGHQRRHAQLHEERSAGQVEERAVGDLVIVTISGHTETWTNEWSGEPSTTAPAPTVPTTTIAPAVNNVPAPTATKAAPPPAAPASDSSSNPVSDIIGNVDSIFQATLNVISDAFGGQTQPSGSGISYVGNVGSPWGSNIIQIAPENVGNFQYTLEISGENLSEPWIVNFWNKIGKQGGLTGFFGESALALSVGPGETKYVAVDQDSQGGFAAAPGGSIPVSSYGSWAATWGEFDFGSTINNGASGFDVSCIQAQAAGLEVQGMQICGSGICSSITPGAAQIDNAYYNIPSIVNAGGIGGNLPKGPVSLKVVLNYGG